MLIGRVRLRLAPTGKAVAIVVFLLGFLSRETSLSIGPAVVLTAMAVTDAVVSARRVHRAELSVIPARSVAALPNALSCIVSVAKCTRPIVFSVSGSRPQSRLALDEKSKPVVLPFRSGHTRKTTFIPFSLSMSTVGLVIAYRVGMVSTPAGLFQGPPTAELEYKLPTQRSDTDLERTREYVPGDRQSRVHWPSLARTGTLLVRDELPVRDEALVVVDLRTDNNSPKLLGEARVQQLEWALSMAAACVEQFLDQGVEVRLITFEPPAAMFDIEKAAMARLIDRRWPKPATNITGGSVVDEIVKDKTDIARRLAVADVGPVPEPHGVGFIRVTRTAVQVCR